MNDTAYSKERQMKWYEIESNSWWFQYRIKIFLYLAEEFLNKNNDIYDIGGSNGFNSFEFQKNGYKIHMIEPTQQACFNARERGVKSIINVSLEEYNGRIEDFLLLDVLEHIENDIDFLEAVNEKMEIGGVGIISVPASMRLWSSEDEVDGHFRRYDELSLKKVVEKSGFSVEFSTYLYRFLWLPIYFRRHLFEELHLVKRVEKRSLKEDDAVTANQFISSRIITQVLWKVLNYEFIKIKKGLRIPCGSSLVCVVKKNS